MKNSLSPENLLYRKSKRPGKYLDYDYIAAMKDDGKGKIKQQEILDSLERKDMQEDFLGNLENRAMYRNITASLSGMYESELILQERGRRICTL